MQRNHIDPFCREILETECRQDRAHYVHLTVKILVNWFINSSNTAGCKMPWGLVVLWLTPSEVSEVSEECVHKAGHTFLHWILLEPSMDNKTLLLVADYLKHLLYPGLQDHRYYLNPTSTSQVLWNLQVLLQHQYPIGLHRPSVKARILIWKLTYLAKWLERDEGLSWQIFITHASDNRLVQEK